MADALLGEGAEVGIVSRRRPEDWEEGPPEDWDPGRDWIRGDLTDAPRLIAAVEGWLGGTQGDLDVLIYCAASYGFGSRHPFAEIEPEEWKECMETNANGPFLLTRSLLPRLLERPRALIIHISSEVAFNPGPKRIAYSASKSAARATFAGLAEELRGSPVAVVGMLPEGMVDTPGIRRRRPPDFDYSSYAPADSFVPATLSAVDEMGASHHEEVLIVEPDGGFRPMVAGRIASQSR